MDQKVSIITPVYNNAGTLREAADSVLQQSHSNWEWIVVDNGSSDDSAILMKEWQADDRVKLISLPNNLGVSGGRNAGLREAQGDFLCFLDADDRLSEGSLGKRLKVMHEEPTVSFVDGAVQRIDMLGNSLTLQRPSFKGEPFDELLSLSGKCFIGITWLIRRKEGFTYSFDASVSHGEDLLFFLSIADHGHYTFIEDVIYFYRSREGSAMHDLDGLEQGYKDLEERLQRRDDVTEKQFHTFQKRWRRVMLKSYLKAGRINDALRMKLR